MWDVLVDGICRPPRDNQYGLEDLVGGEKCLYRLGGAVGFRHDLQLVNRRGLKLACSHYIPLHLQGKENRLPCVVYAHCNSGSRRDAEEAVLLLNPLGISVFALDFSGSGHSEGEWVTLGANEAEDLECVLEYLEAVGHVSAVGLWGRSMGAVSALLCQKKPGQVAAMVLDSPFCRLRELVLQFAEQLKLPLPRYVLGQLLGSMRRSVQRRARFDIDAVAPIDVVASTTIPAIFGHGLEDVHVGARHSKKLHTAYKGEKSILFFRGNHLTIRPAFFYRTVAAFFHHKLGAGQHHKEALSITYLDGLCSLVTTMLEARITAEDINDTALIELLGPTAMTRMLAYQHSRPAFKSKASKTPRTKAGRRNASKPTGATDPTTTTATVTTTFSTEATATPAAKDAKADPLHNPPMEDALKAAPAPSPTRSSHADDAAASPTTPTSPAKSAAAKGIWDALTASPVGPPKPIATDTNPSATSDPPHPLTPSQATPTTAAPPSDHPSPSESHPTPPGELPVLLPPALDAPPNPDDSAAPPTPLRRVTAQHEMLRQHRNGSPTPAFLLSTYDYACCPLEEPLDDDSESVLSLGSDPGIMPRLEPPPSPPTSSAAAALPTPRTNPKPPPRRRRKWKLLSAVPTLDGTVLCEVSGHSPERQYRWRVVSNDAVPDLPPTLSPRPGTLPTLTPTTTTTDARASQLLTGTSTATDAASTTTSTSTGTTTATDATSDTAGIIATTVVMAPSAPAAGHRASGPSSSAARRSSAASELLELLDAHDAAAAAAAAGRRRGLPFVARRSEYAVTELDADCVSVSEFGDEVESVLGSVMEEEAGGQATGAEGRGAAEAGWGVVEGGEMRRSGVAFRDANTAYRMSLPKPAPSEHSSGGSTLNPPAHPAQPAHAPSPRSLPTSPLATPRPCTSPGPPANNHPHLSSYYYSRQQLVPRQLLPTVPSCELTPSPPTAPSTTSTSHQSAPSTPSQPPAAPLSPALLTGNSTVSSDSTPSPATILPTHGALNLSHFTACIPARPSNSSLSTGSSKGTFTPCSTPLFLPLPPTGTAITLRPDTPPTALPPGTVYTPSRRHASTSTRLHPALSHPFQPPPAVTLSAASNIPSSTCYDTPRNFPTPRTPDAPSLDSPPASPRNNPLFRGRHVQTSSSISSALLTPPDSPVAPPAPLADRPAPAAAPSSGSSSPAPPSARRQAATATVPQRPTPQRPSSRASSSSSHPRGPRSATTPRSSARHHRGSRHSTTPRGHRSSHRSLSEKEAMKLLSCACFLAPKKRALERQQLQRHLAQVLQQFPRS